ncbi:hypothetical protein [Planotetraspora sp. GP83]|uniref:hypothetical protein n=1 Tax=Planotetraspora sp. GP83 TaxID=3156264 RepID=UPI003515B280
MARTVFTVTFQDEQLDDLQVVASRYDTDEYARFVRFYDDGREVTAVVFHLVKAIRISGYAPVTSPGRAADAAPPPAPAAQPVVPPQIPAPGPQQPEPRLPIAAQAAAAAAGR